MRFEDYWENYGELHASMCGGDIKQFAKEIWMSAKGNTEEEAAEWADQIWFDIRDEIQMRVDNDVPLDDELIVQAKLVGVPLPDHRFDKREKEVMDEYDQKLGTRFLED